MTTSVSDQLSDQIASLQWQLRTAQRAQVQAERMARRSEALALQSKRAMLRTYAELRTRLDDLRSAKTAAEAAAANKGRLMATMSHELRTPLNGMVGSVDLLLMTLLREDQRELVELLQRSGNALLTIVNDVLDYSRLEADRMPIERIPFRLEQCVRDVVELQRPVSNEKGLELRLRLEPDVPQVVVGDPGRLRQVLMNLLTNALKFTSSGRVEVTVEPGPAPDELVFGVSDTGIGISEDAQVYLFDAYAQACVSTVREFGGTGLGLAVSKRLVALMGGEIGVVSTPGEGSTFTFSCALPTANDTVVERDCPAVTVPTPHALANGHVLVVDDNASNRLIIRKMLEQLGYTCDEAKDGVDAAAHAARRDYCLVLMDCNMPIMDGYDATHLIRSLPSSRCAVPILALTGKSLPEDEARCRDAGMDGFIAKPVRLGDLDAAVNRVLRG